MRRGDVVLAALALGGMGAVLGVVPGAARIAEARRGPTPPPLAGAYDATFTELANTCATPPITLTRGTFTIERKGKRVTVSLPMIPILRGSTTREGGFRVRARRGRTAIQGLEGEFNAAGQVDDAGRLQLVLHALYFAGGRPYCQQSWDARGSRRASPKDVGSAGTE